MRGHTDYNAWLVREKLKYLQFLPKDVSSVLDVGCGRGEFLYLLKERGIQAEGCDIDDVLLEKSARFARVKKVNVLELSQAYPENSFDLVTCLHTLEHTLHPHTTLQELKKVTRKYILLAVPNARYIAHNERATHLYSWNGDTLKNLIECAGLELLKLQQDRTNMFPNVLRLTPVINRLLLKIFIGPNELVALCSK
jgi:2-polyprenyl-3-methyl-5-hydroxy-6-metoxy-1,4-benzoquinol methylase